MEDVWDPNRKPESPIRETVIEPGPGIGWLIGLLATMLASVGVFIAGAVLESPALLVLPILTFVAAIFGLTGLFIVNPNEAKVLQLFGDYKGTVRTPGLRWVNPLYAKRAISTKIRNFESGRLKVNDKNGNPVEIAAVVVWRVIDTAEALFHVDRYENFVEVQSESALRNLASGYPYDAHQEGVLSLQGTTSEVAEHLRNEIQDRLFKAGVEVIEARISHLAYAPEIAHAMLQRQQADAVIAARARRSSRAPSAWSRWPSACSPTRSSSTSTTSRRPRWSATCWSSSAPTAAPSRSSAPAAAARASSSERAAVSYLANLRPRRKIGQVWGSMSGDRLPEVRRPGPMVMGSGLGQDRWSVKSAASCSERGPASSRGPNRLDDDHRTIGGPSRLAP